MPDFETLAWAGIFAPAGTPPEIVNALAGALQQALAKPDVASASPAPECKCSGRGRRSLADFVKAELVRYNAMIKEAGIEPE